jgi:GNAT superfamily N-acetyltransferase
MAEVEVTDRPPAADLETLAQGVAQFMRSTFPRGLEERPLAVFARASDGALIGGLSGVTGKDEFFVSDFFVAANERRRGLGTKLLQAGEAEARARGCLAAWLMTSSAEAKAFYEKLGYRTFGVVERLAPSPPRFFLSKLL